jgi:putative transposase
VSAFIESQKAAGFAVELTCRTLGVSRSAHYERASGERSQRAIRDEELVAMIRRLHEANFEAYGYRKLHLALRRAGVEDVGRDRVKRLMRSHGIRGAKRRGRRFVTTKGDPNAARLPDLVQRDFTATAPDRLYVADFTYIRCWEGMVFFAFVIDVFSRRVVGWQLAGHMRASLVCDALRMALSTRAPGADVELVHNSDRGSQYTSIEFAQVLDEARVLASLGSVGDCYDTALAESFVDTIKTELVADRVWRSRDQLELAIVEYLGWFNQARLHQSLGDIPPAEFEALHAPRFETSTPTIKIWKPTITVSAKPSPPHSSTSRPEPQPIPRRDAKHKRVSPPPWPRTTAGMRSGQFSCTASPHSRVARRWGDGYCSSTGVRATRLPSAASGRLHLVPGSRLVSGDWDGGLAYAADYSAAWPRRSR